MKSLNVRTFGRSIVLSPWPHIVWVALTIVHYTSLWILLPAALVGAGQFFAWLYLLTLLGWSPENDPTWLAILIRPWPLQLHLAWLAVCLVFYVRFERSDGAVRTRRGLVGWYRVYAARVFGAEWTFPVTMAVLLNVFFVALVLVWVTLRLAVGAAPFSRPGDYERGDASLYGMIVYFPLNLFVLTPWVLITWSVVLVRARRFARRRFGWGVYS